MPHDKPNFVPNNPHRGGPQGGQPPQQPHPSPQFGPGQSQPHMDGRGQSGQPPKK